MRIAVITLPLHLNYGGILQAYALKTVLEDMGHEVDVIDRKDKFPVPPAWKMPFVYLKRISRNILLSGKGPEIFREKRMMNNVAGFGVNLSPFVASRISPRVVDDYRSLSKGEYDALVVGSDQVWRPKYFGKIEDAFLHFAVSWHVKRIAYAASFGTLHPEYTARQLETCSSLLKTFDAVSVREDSGVNICDELLDVERVTHVLDPVMLLDKKHLYDMASLSSGHPASGKMLTFVLDEEAQKKAVIDRVSSWFSGNVYDASVFPFDEGKPVSERMPASMEEWLSCFADCSFVVTDSFHACVVSILFHKPFIVLGNPARGLTRITSLLELFGLESRMVHGMDPDDEPVYYLEGIDWEDVDTRLDRMRNLSMEFLNSALK